MGLIDWAKHEIELAKQFERKESNNNEDEFDYGCACYDSALKAFKSLCDDGHSGFSIKITQEILNKLIDGKPLRPIVDEDFENTENNFWLGPYCESFNHSEYVKTGIVSVKQCPRMSSLFRTEYDDGTIEYTDVNRVVGHNLNDNFTYQGGGVTSIVDKLFPIKMPYMPYNKPFVVWTDDFSMTMEQGVYDHKAYYYCETPWGERIEINKFEREDETGKWVNITEEEYNADKQIALSCVHQD